MFDVTPTTLHVQNIEGCNEVVDEGLFIPGCVGEASMDVARGGMKLRKCWRFNVTPTTLDVQSIEGCNEVVGEGLFIPGCVGEASTIDGCCARRHGWNACGKMCHIVWVGCVLSAAGDGFG